MPSTDDVPVKRGAPLTQRPVTEYVVVPVGVVWLWLDDVGVVEGVSGGGRLSAVQESMVRQGVLADRLGYREAFIRAQTSDATFEGLDPQHRELEGRGGTHQAQLDPGSARLEGRI